MRLKMKRRRYIKPAIERVGLDSSISLVMMTVIPPNPPPRGSDNSGGSSPFASPFNNRPFN